MKYSRDYLIEFYSTRPHLFKKAGITLTMVRNANTTQIDEYIKKLNEVL